MVGVGWRGGRRFSFEHLKGRGKELPKLNKFKQGRGSKFWTYCDKGILECPPRSFSLSLCFIVMLCFLFVGSFVL